MNLRNAYWYFTSQLGDNFCDEVIQLGNSKQEKIGVTGGASDRVKKRKPGVNPNSVEKLLNKKELKSLKKQRDSNVVWLNDQWIYDELCPLIAMANQNAGWNFQYDYFEAIQFTKYKLNQHYTWHKDSQFAKDKNEPIRKISSVIFLNNPKDYKGGEFQFKLDNERKQNIIKLKPEVGTVIVFPSFITHRVTPVTSGVRHTLVSWTKGPQFK